jgi:phosphatidylglycerol:prolipoprotein diacylglycerol transferase
MLPDIPLGPLPIKGYGLMIGLGILFSFWIAIHESRRTGMKILEDRIITLFFAAVGAAFIGGKLFFFMLYRESATRSFREDGLFGVLSTGFVFYGSLLLAVPSAIWLLRRWNLPVLRTLDVLIPLVPVAHGMGRIGCFLSGCCYGCRSNAVLAVTFSKGQGLNGVPLHPVQLYEAAGNLLVFLVLWFGPRRRARFPGHVTLVYLLLYSILRFVTEIFRGDGNPVWIGARMARLPGDPPSGLTQPQVTSIIIFIVAAVLLRVRLRRAVTGA